MPTGNVKLSIYVWRAEHVNCGALKALNEPFTCWLLLIWSG